MDFVLKKMFDDIVVKGLLEVCKEGNLVAETGAFFDQSAAGSIGVLGLISVLLLLLLLLLLLIMMMMMMILLI
jgi:hypothetical protein